MLFRPAAALASHFAAQNAPVMRKRRSQSRQTIGCPKPASLRASNITGRNLKLSRIIFVPYASLVHARTSVCLGGPSPPPPIKRPRLAVPGFPVDLGGAGELHAPFLTERRTSCPIPSCKAGNQGVGPRPSSAGLLVDTIDCLAAIPGLL
jgi:hypothetical protein